MRSESGNRILNFRLFAKKILISVQIRYGIGKKSDKISDYPISTPWESEIGQYPIIFCDRDDAIGRSESTEQWCRSACQSLRNTHDTICRDLIMILVLKIGVGLTWFVSGFGVTDCCNFGVI